MVLEDNYSGPDSGRDLRDPNFAGNSGAARPIERQLANPMDRLAAVVADLILFVPLALLVVAPFSRRAKEAQLLGFEEAWFGAVLSAIFTAAFLFVILQTFFISVFGGTPGKLILKLRVVSAWGGTRPRPMDAFLRAIVWCMEAVLLGMPWLAVFGNQRRRPFHDRISDTLVVCLSPRRQVGTATVPEMSLAQGFQASSLALVTLALVANLIEYRKDHDAVAEAALRAEEEGRLCADVRESMREPSSEKSGGHATPHLKNRLSTALTMFTVGVLSRECLEAESDFAIWQNKEKALAYLGKSVVAGAKGKIDLQRSYLDRVCPPDKVRAESDLCRMAQALVIESELAKLKEAKASRATQTAVSKRQLALRQMMETVGPQNADYLRAKALQQARRQNRHERALALLNSLRGPKKLGAFVSRERAKVLWEDGRKNEAMLAMRSTADLLERGGRAELARWFCFHETFMSGNCNPESKFACEELREAVAGFDGRPLEHLMQRPEIATAYFRAQTCHARQTANQWRSLQGDLKDENAKVFVEALALLEEGAGQKAKDKFNSIVESRLQTGDKDHEPYVLEASSRLAEMARSPAQLTLVLHYWHQLAPGDDNWQLLGQRLVKKLNDLQAWRESVKIGSKLNQFAPQDRVTLQMLAIAARQAGELGSVSRLSIESSPQRGPASLPLEPKERVDGDQP